MALDDGARNWTPLGAGPPIPGGQRGLPGAGGWATPSMWVPVRARGSHHAQGKGGSGRWAPERPAAACFAYSGTGVATMSHYGQRRQQTVPQRDEEGNNENTSSPPSGRDAHLQSADARGAINSGPTRYAPPARKDNVPCLSSERTYCRRPRNGGAPQPSGVAGRGGAGSVGLPTSAPRRDAQCGNARGEMRPRHRHRQCNRPDTAACPLPVFASSPPQGSRPHRWCSRDRTLAPTAASTLSFSASTVGGGEAGASAGLAAAPALASVPGLAAAPPGRGGGCRRGAGGDDHGRPSGPHGGRWAPLPWPWPWP